MTSFYSSRHDRCSIECEIEFFLDLSSQNTYKGYIENISESGCCLITSALLEKEQEIVIKTNIFLPSHSASVCWVEHIEPGQYRVGLNFL
jgi:hypothetical protein